MVIYNQQYISGDRTVRLTLLPMEEYMAITGGTRSEFFQYVFEQQGGHPSRLREAMGRHPQSHTVGNHRWRTCGRQ